MPAGASLRERAAAVAGGPRAQRLYDEDIWTWARDQAEALRRRDVDAIDWENVVEEIETVGRSEEHAWTSLCTNVISHLLKIEHSGRRDSVNHWSREIRGYRQRMYRRLMGGRGMKGKLSELLQVAWKDGRKDGVEKLAEHGAPDDAAAEKRLRDSWRRQLPVDCPYHLEDIAGYDPHDKNAEPRDEVWPAPVARRLNEDLGTDYPVRFRGAERSP